VPWLGRDPLAAKPSRKGWEIARYGLLGVVSAGKPLAIKLKGLKATASLVGVAGVIKRRAVR
jgi:hypothetical protein